MVIPESGAMLRFEMGARDGERLVIDGICDYADTAVVLKWSLVYASTWIFEGSRPNVVHASTRHFRLCWRCAVSDIINITL